MTTTLSSILFRNTLKYFVSQFSLWRIPTKCIVTTDIIKEVFSAVLIFCVFKIRKLIAESGYNQCLNPTDSRIKRTKRGN